MQRPDLVVVDIRMPPGHSTEGLDAAMTIREEFPATGIMVLSAYVHAEHAVTLLSSGQGIGYLLKTASKTSRSSSGRCSASPAVAR